MGAGGERAVCGLSKPLDGCAPGSSFPGDDSPVVWEMQSCFSLQCINRWLGQITLVLYAGASGSFRSKSWQARLEHF